MILQESVRETNVGGTERGHESPSEGDEIKPVKKNGLERVSSVLNITNDLRTQL